MEVQHPNKVSRGYTPGFGGHGLRTAPGSPNPALPRDIIGVAVGGGYMCTWGHSQTKHME